MISIECFNGLPLEYESFLIEKYDSFMVTCRYAEIYYPSYDVNYMLVYEDDKLIELLLFGNIGNTSLCFNSLAEINQDIITECTTKIFEKYPAINKIKIDASYVDYNLKKSFLNFKSDDQILDLPLTIDDYYLELGYHTRKNIKNRKVRLLRDYPAVKFITKFGLEIDESIIDKIILLNKDRMEYKGKTPAIDEAFKNNIYQFARHYGCVAYIEIDGLIVAGCIATILKKRIFAHVIAHDNNFSKYNVGESCIFYLIQTSIEKGMATFHFLWGENEYKKRLLAKNHVLYFYSIHRKYSFNYFMDGIKTLFSNALSNIERSKYSKPIREVIKFYRKNKRKVKSTDSVSSNLKKISA
ncbi:MAG: GNAT family N-acetyltransferase [Paludibacter sp.]|nr:GNAT family N-acetyltransferase [Paludibacter sp.]